MRGRRVYQGGARIAGEWSILIHFDEDAYRFTTEYSEQGAKAIAMAAPYLLSDRGRWRDDGARSKRAVARALHELAPDISDPTFRRALNGYEFDAAEDRWLTRDQAQRKAAQEGI